MDAGEEEEKKGGRGSGSGGSDPQLVEAVREGFKSLTKAVKKSAAETQDSLQQLLWAVEDRVAPWRDWVALTREEQEEFEAERHGMMEERARWYRWMREQREEVNGETDEEQEEEEDQRKTEKRIRREKRREIEEQEKEVAEQRSDYGEEMEEENEDDKDGEGEMEE